ncbi:MAG: phenylacetate--CoA ligase family protein, partial [Bacteroidota bacterium]|nr:phenylacetate--CoA ligase family protein [Bacteroidota bacterium]
MNNIEIQLINQIKYTLLKSDFYKNKYKNVLLSDTFQLNQFQSLPYTTKSELLKDQENFPPFGSNVCVNNEDIIRIH